MYDLKIKINLNKVDDILTFTNGMSKLTSDVDVLSGRFIVSATSLLGIMSLDLSKDIYVGIYARNEEELKKFEELVKDYKVEV